MMHKRVRFIWSLKGSIFPQVLPYFLSIEPILSMTSKRDQKSKQLPCSCSSLQKGSQQHTLETMLCTSENNSPGTFFVQVSQSPSFPHNIQYFPASRKQDTCFIMLQCTYCAALQQSECFWKGIHLSAQHCQSLHRQPPLPSQSWMANAWAHSPVQDCSRVVRDKLNCKIDIHFNLFSSSG